MIHCLAKNPSKGFRMATLSLPDSNKVSGELKAGKCARELSSLLWTVFWMLLSSSSARGKASACICSGNGACAPWSRGSTASKSLSPGISCDRGPGADVITNEKLTGDGGGVAHSRTNTLFIIFVGI